MFNRKLLPSRNFRTFSRFISEMLRVYAVCAEKRTGAGVKWSDYSPLPRLTVPAMRLFCFFVTIALPGLLPAQEAVMLRERFDPGHEYHVTTRVDLRGELTIPVDKDKPAELVKMTGRGSIDYGERVLTLEGNAAAKKTIRQYKSIDFRRQTGDRLQEISLRPEVKRIVVMKRPGAKVSFSPDGPLLWGEIDMLRTDVFVPWLSGLLPDRATKPGETWRVSDEAVAELTDMDKIERGGLTGKFEAVEAHGGRQLAHITLAGDLEGVNEDGPNRQRLSCRLYYDIRGEYISYLSINGEHFLLDKNGKVNGQFSGEFVMIRQLNPRSAALTNEALARVKLDPTIENTQLLFDDADAGVRFTYPRRWRLGRVQKGQITLDENGGSGLLISLEPGTRVPHAANYLKEAQGYLQQQKSTIHRTTQPVRLSNAPNELDQFAIESEVANQRVIMDYLVARQPNGGATFAGRLIYNDREALVRDVEGIARSLVLSKKLEAK